PGIEGNDLDSYKTLLQLEFDKATKEGLMAQREAQKRVESRDFDGAIEILKGYNARLADTGLPPEQIAVLRRPTDRYVQQYQTRKAQEEFAREQNNVRSGRSHEEERQLRKRERDTEIVKLMDQYGQFMRDGKFDQAMVVAHKAHDLDPDNQAAQIGINQARTAARLKVLEEKGEEKEKWFLEELDVYPGPRTTWENPVNFNQNITERAKDRKPLMQIQSPYRDKTEQYLERVLAERKVSVSFKDTPLYQAVDTLRDMHGDININFDQAALAQAGINKNQPLTQSFNNISLKSALNILLKDAGLTYTISQQTV